MSDLDDGARAAASRLDGDRGSFDAQDLAEDLISQALDAMRQGGLEAMVRERPRAARWLMRRHLDVVEGTLGQAAPTDPPSLAVLLLQWLITQLRPDGEASFEHLPAQVWADAAAWRPMITVASQCRVLLVPRMPQVYRAKDGEPPLEQLAGIWSVDMSTMYRYLERGKRRMAQLAIERLPPATRRLSLRAFVVSSVTTRLGVGEGAARTNWHLSQAAWATRTGRPTAALWHACQAGQPAMPIKILLDHANILAGEPETDALVHRVASMSLTSAERTELWLVRGLLARVRNAPDRELHAYEQVLRSATEAGDPLRLGLAYSALARYYEPRDADRALAAYGEAERLLKESDPDLRSPEVLGPYMNALVRLAWVHVLRIHPRAQALLKQASAMCQSHDVSDETRGMVEQTWGEYWRLAGDLPRAIEAKHRALAISQRRGDLRAVLVSYLNLVLCYGEAKDVAQAKAYAQKVFESAKTHTVEPALLVSTHHNLAIAHVYASRYDLAIDSFQVALELSVEAKLNMHANRARFNLANAYFHRFVETGEQRFEQLGDAQLEAFNSAPPGESPPAHIEEAKTLKAEVLGQRPERPIDYLLDGEAQEHVPQAYEIKRQQAVLADPASDDRARHAARLAIAKAYHAMALAEYAAAEQLAVRLGLSGPANHETSMLGQALQGDLSAESRARAKWDREAGDMLAAERRTAVLDHLLREGAINKSGYAELCGVSPATASKHLATLAERGLLTQTGKGPATRYRLP